MENSAKDPEVGENVGCEYFVQINILAATFWTRCNLYKAPSVKFVAWNYKDQSNLKSNHEFVSVHQFTLTPRPKLLRMRFSKLKNADNHLKISFLQKWNIKLYKIISPKKLE